MNRLILNAFNAFFLLSIGMAQATFVPFQGVHHEDLDQGIRKETLASFQRVSRDTPLSGLAVERYVWPTQACSLVLQLRADPQNAAELWGVLKQAVPLEIQADRACSLTRGAMVPLLNQLYKNHYVSSGCYDAIFYALNSIMEQTPSNELPIPLLPGFVTKREGRPVYVRETPAEPGELQRFYFDVQSGRVCVRYGSGFETTISMDDLPHESLKPNMIQAMTRLFNQQNP